MEKADEIAGSTEKVGDIVDWSEQLPEENKPIEQVNNPTDQVTEASEGSVVGEEHEGAEETGNAIKEQPVKKIGRPPKRAQSTDECTSARKKEKKSPKEVKPKRKAESVSHGVLTSPLQSEPAVKNPYNYDPLTEVMPLGKGQLQSAYRNTKNNIAPPKSTKIYKLEHKSSYDVEPAEPVPCDPSGDHNHSKSQENVEAPVDPAPQD